ncbi:MAG: hypothetical protein KGQ51_08590, partial [Planctomycetes bacterium]|nr:hypothetical protein [Planctomycetota bacterium]
MRFLRLFESRQAFGAGRFLDLAPNQRAFVRRSFELPNTIPDPTATDTPTGKLPKKDSGDQQ